MELKFQVGSNINLHFQFSLQAPYLTRGIILRDFSEACLTRHAFVCVSSLWQLLQNDKSDHFARLK